MIQSSASLVSNPAISSDRPMMSGYSRAHPCTSPTGGLTFNTLGFVDQVTFKNRRLSGARLGFSMIIDVISVRSDPICERVTPVGSRNLGTSVTTPSIPACTPYAVNNVHGETEMDSGEKTRMNRRDSHRNERQK